MITQIVKKITQIGLAIVLVLGFVGVACAEETNKEEKIETVVNQVTGEVSAISKNFIAVVHGLDAKGEAALEIPFNIGKDIKIEHKRSLSEISVGDTVMVTYEDRIKQEQEETRVLSRVPKVISFLRPAQKSLVSVAPQEEAPQVEAPQEEGLPLKGIRGE